MDIEEEKNALRHATAISRMTADRMQSQDRENQNLWVAFAVMLAINMIAILVIFGSCTWAMSHAQEVANEAVANAFETISEMEISGDTTTVTQDTGEGGGNAVFQIGQYARFSEGGDDS